jgi:hypothetical protein
MNKQALPGLNGSQPQKPLAPPQPVANASKQKKPTQPAVQLPTRKSDQHPLHKAKSNFICHNVKFQSALPTIPLDAKMLTYPLDPQRFVPFQLITGMEKKHKFQLLTDPDLGIHIDLIDPEAYKVPEGMIISKHF